MKLFLLFFCSLIAGNLSAQKQIRGRIIDSTTGKPFANEYYYVLKDEDGFVDIDKTDSNGYFITIISQKEYKRKASYQVFVTEYGYKNKMINVTPGSGEVITISMIPDKNYFFPYEGMTYMHCSSHEFGDYEPKQPESMDDLPPYIREKLAAYLIAKLGREFYSKLVLNDGQLVDIDRFRKVNKDHKEYQWKQYSYYLCFSFRDTAAGIARYTANIVMDKNGKVIEDIELPYITKDPSKGRFISSEKAKRIAGPFAYPEELYHDFEYDDKYDCFTWVFDMTCYDTANSYVYKYVTVAAHNGEILEKREGRAARDSGMFLKQKYFYMREIDK